MTPVHHARNNDSIDIAKNFLERLAFFGRLGGQRSQNRARLVVRRDPQRSQGLPKICDPIGQFMQLSAEFLRRSITKILSVFHSLGIISPRITRITLITEGFRRASVLSISSPFASFV